jgi:16S rRNA (adenine1518-N6/adenine1519-N6)-dimethyltransferase
LNWRADLRQRLGQHFLVKGKALDRIAKAACGDHTSLVVEIGPGRGALTEKLLERADRVAAIELDPGLAEHVRTRWPAVELVEVDALHVDWSQWGSGVLTGNLPYYIATPIISRYLRQPGPLSSAVFLIQKEVAERITARPGTREYGYFSVECQFLAQAEYLFTLPPGAFRPPPKVDSAVIRLTPRSKRDVEGFLDFVSICFRQKRKTLKNNLREAYGPAPDTAHWANRRAEELTVDEFLDLFRTLGPPKSGPQDDPGLLQT